MPDTSPASWRIPCPPPSAEVRSPSTQPGSSPGSEPGSVVDTSGQITPRSISLTPPEEPLVMAVVIGLTCPVLRFKSPELKEISYTVSPSWPPVPIWKVRVRPPPRGVGPELVPSSGVLTAINALAVVPPLITAIPMEQSGLSEMSSSSGVQARSCWLDACRSGKLDPRDQYLVYAWTQARPQ